MEAAGCGACLPEFLAWWVLYPGRWWEEGGEPGGGQNQGGPWRSGGSVHTSLSGPKDFPEETETVK